MPGINLKLADDFAPEYDASILQNNWIGPRVLFNLIQVNLFKQSQVLDLGIGTGESARPFVEKGHKVTGLDGSEKMLDECRRKKICDQLIFHNLEINPYPFPDNSFDAVVSNGVFHLIHPLQQVFQEVTRLLKPNGFFVFSYEATNSNSGSRQIESGIWEKETETGVLTYKHENRYIDKLLNKYQFEKIRQTQFLAFVNQKSDTKFYFEAIAAQLILNR
jgi:ubiquinone/menaquinone biosynthesis C-methylase UbiE